MNICLILNFVAFIVKRIKEKRSLKISLEEYGKVIIFMILWSGMTFHISDEIKIKGNFAGICKVRMKRRKL